MVSGVCYTDCHLAGGTPRRGLELCVMQSALLAFKLTVLLGLVALAAVWPPDSAMAAGGTLTSPDTAGRVGRDTSLVLDASGYPVVAYFDDTNDALKLLHCDDPGCDGAGESIVVLDAVDILASISLMLDAVGNPVVSYWNYTTGDLSVLHCGNPDCTSGNSIVSPDTEGDVGWGNSLALDSAGYPVVSYLDLTNRDLKLLHCGNANCTSGNSITSPDTDNDTGWYSSLELDAVGNPVISYRYRTSGNLRIMHCNDPNCAGGDESITSPDVFGDVGWNTSMELDQSGNPVVAYNRAGAAEVKLLHCGDEDCSSGNSVSVIDASGSMFNPSLALDAVGNPVVSYNRNDIGQQQLKVMHCNDANCVGGDESIIVADAGASYSHSSLALDASGNPIVSYFEGHAADLKLLHCGDPNCDHQTDSDGDGCTDFAEKGPDETVGGLRDIQNPWDFFDVLGGGGSPPDGIIDLPNDILGVIQHFSPSGAEPYDVIFDRGPSSGPNPWNMTAPDGVIDLPNDIMGVIMQFNHDCR